MKGVTSNIGVQESNFGEVQGRLNFIVHRPHMIIVGADPYFSAKYGEIKGNNFKGVQGCLSLFAHRYGGEFVGEPDRRGAGFVLG